MVSYSHRDGRLRGPSVGASLWGPKGFFQAGHGSQEGGPHGVLLCRTQGPEERLSEIFRECAVDVEGDGKVGHFQHVGDCAENLESTRH